MRLAFYVLTEVAAYAVGVLALLALAGVAAVCLFAACAVLTAGALRDETAYLWERIRSRRSDTAGG